VTGGTRFQTPLAGKRFWLSLNTWCPSHAALSSCGGAAGYERDLFLRSTPRAPVSSPLFSFPRHRRSLPLLAYTPGPSGGCFILFFRQAKTIRAIRPTMFHPMLSTNSFIRGTWAAGLALARPGLHLAFAQPLFHDPRSVARRSYSLWPAVDAGRPFGSFSGAAISCRFFCLVTVFSDYHRQSTRRRHVSRSFARFDGTCDT